MLRRVLEGDLEVEGLGGRMRTHARSLLVPGWWLPPHLFQAGRSSPAIRRPQRPDQPDSCCATSVIPRCWVVLAYTHKNMRIGIYCQGWSASFLCMTAPNRVTAIAVRRGHGSDRCGQIAFADGDLRPYCLILGEPTGGLPWCVDAPSRTAGRPRFGGLHLSLSKAVARRGQAPCDVNNQVTSE